ncbi:MAG: ABC transporter ATP-binding protein [Verrucomicrobiota bacterium]
MSVGFGSGSNRTEVLEGINLEIEKGEFVALVGYSGTGKTTLINLIAGLLIPDEGEVLVDGKVVEGPDPERGLVFQNYSLLPWLSVHRNVGVAVDEVFMHEEAARKVKRIRKAIDQVNLTDAAHKKPGELSGGMRQRNSVARTLSMNPTLLLLDEPLSALDALTRSVIQDEILGIWEAEGQTVVMITNDVDEGLYMADRIIPLSVGPPATLGMEVEIGVPRPRSRHEIHSGGEFKKMRSEIINFLLEEKARERARSESKAVSLPNIAPVDISQHRPRLIFGIRPKPKKVLSTR